MSFLALVRARGRDSPSPRSLPIALFGQRFFHPPNEPGDSFVNLMEEMVTFDAPEGDVVLVELRHKHGVVCLSGMAPLDERFLSLSGGALLRKDVIHRYR